MPDQLLPPLLEMRGISKGFSGVPVLRGVSLGVGRGRILGLVGENGAGKSTLMNTLGGVVAPEAGTMYLDGRPHDPRTPADAARAGVAFIHQELNLFGNLSVAENLHIESPPRVRLAGLRLPLVDRAAMRERARRMLAEVDPAIDPAAPVADLSPGRRQLVEIARALGSDAKLIILDEPTTSLTAPESSRLFELLGRLRGRGVGMIFISHNLPDVLRLCDDIAVLRDGALVSTGPRAAYTEDRLIAEMVGRGLEAPARDRPDRVGRRPLLEVEDLARPPTVRGVSFTLHAGEILGVAGLMGAGRTELARLLFGLEPIAAGAVRLDGRPLVPSPRRCIRRGMAFLTEDRRVQGLMLDSGVLENAALVALPEFTRTPLRLVRGRRLRGAVEATAEAVRLRAAGGLRQAVRTLSGGNQQKVVLAKWLLARPSVVLLDEPTRGIDVGAKQEVYRIVKGLAQEGAGVLVISSEIEELVALCDRILVMAAGRLRDDVPRSEFDPERILRAALRVRETEEPAA